MNQDAERRLETAMKAWCLRQTGAPATAIGVRSVYFTTVDCELCGQLEVTVHATFSCRNDAGRVRTYAKDLGGGSLENFLIELFETGGG